MKNVEDHLSILGQGVGLWNKWRRENPDIQANLSGVNLEHRDLAEVNLIGADLRGTNLRAANLSRAYLYRANLNRATLSNANLTGAVFSQSTVWPDDYDPIVHGARNLFNRGHYERLIEGVEAWNQWRIINPDVYPKLGGAKLGGMPLNGANLIDTMLDGADLSKADLRNANLEGVKLQNADLSDANISNTDLSRANLSDANITEADFRGAVLRRVNLSAADLHDVNFQDAIMPMHLTMPVMMPSNLPSPTNKDLRGAVLRRAKMQKTNLTGASMWNANLHGSDLRGANLREAVFSSSTKWPDDFEVDSVFHHVASRESRFSVSFDRRLTQAQIVAALNALADYYRACGGIGFTIDFETERKEAEKSLYVS